jgi:hypothetical protein
VWLPAILQQYQVRFADGRSSLWLRAGLDDVHSVSYNGPFNILGALERLLELDASRTQACAQLHTSQR